MSYFRDFEAHFPSTYKNISMIYNQNNNKRRKDKEFDITCWHNSLTALHQLVMVGSNGWHQQSLAPVVHRQLYPVLSQGRTWCHVTPVLQLSTCLLSSCGVRSIFIGSTSPVHSNPRCVLYTIHHTE